MEQGEKEQHRKGMMVEMALVVAKLELWVVVVAKAALEVIQILVKVVLAGSG